MSTGRSTAIPVEQIAPSKFVGTTPIEPRSGRTVETRTSPALTIFLARLGAASTNMLFALTQPVRISMSDISMYGNWPS